MIPIEFYPTLKQVHVMLALASISLFAARGAGVLAGRRWPMSALPRSASMVIDTLLLGAGGALWWLLSLNPGRDRWLGVKLVLIVLYIVLGSLALKRAPSRAAKAVAFVAALTCIGMAAAIALTHDALVLGRLLAGTL
jgi:uncharacterized membrane protein SirB2